MVIHVTTGRRRFADTVLNPWALVPCAILLIISYMAAALAIMKAREAGRPMNAAETVMSLFPWVFVLWAAVILIRWGMRLVRGK